MSFISSKSRINLEPSKFSIRVEVEDGETISRQFDVEYGTKGILFGWKRMFYCTRRETKENKEDRKGETKAKRL